MAPINDTNGWGTVWDKHEEEMEMATTAKKTTETQVITINKVQVKKADITIVGDTPLIVHSWSEKAKKEKIE